jgi:hypothetical protein
MSVVASSPNGGREMATRMPLGDSFARIVVGDVTLR